MVFTALILGFTGSMHCIGMCSPLAMAVTNLSSRAWLNRLLYNSGRVLTYSLLGLAAASTDAWLPVSKYQNLISITIGIVLLIMGIGGTGGMKIPFVTEGIVKFISLLKKIFSHYLQQKNIGAVFMMGMVNGFLPCGLTFIALMFCLTLQSPLEGFVYMLLFGVGTLPAMLGLTVLINPLIKKFQWSMRHVVTILLITSGCLLIARAFVSHASHGAIQSAHETQIEVCR